ncbi:MAG: hypothetical protein AAB672_01895 [Patescibacteria group bacterium]
MRNFYISFGVWLIIITQLGVPIVWRDSLVFVSGLFLILVSVGPIILKKLQNRTTSSPALPLAKGKGEEREELKFSDFPSPEQGEGRVGL